MLLITYGYGACPVQYIKTEIQITLHFPAHTFYSFFNAPKVELLLQYSVPTKIQLYTIFSFVVCQYLMHSSMRELIPHM